MSSLESFETLLKDIVNSKRLSASKMTKLTEIAVKNMENDTQLVSILYRTHKSLPVASKVSSLYAFDALARAARSHANKNGITGDHNAPKGNTATFLLKMEGVLEGLVQDMMSTNLSETQVSILNFQNMHRKPVSPADSADVWPSRLAQWHTPSLRLLARQLLHCCVDHCIQRQEWQLLSPAMLLCVCGCTRCHRERPPSTMA